MYELYDLQLRGTTVVVSPDGAQALTCLVARLLSCIAQSEQYPVRTNDIPATQQQGGGTLRGANALRFFQTHQIKVGFARFADSSPSRRVKTIFDIVTLTYNTDILSIA